MIKKVLMSAALGAALLVGTFAPAAQADSLYWRIQNMSPWVVHLRFYNADDGYDVWPSISRSWTLDTTKVYYFNLECNGGEIICLGASNDGTAYWGVGLYNNNYPCDECCYACGDETQLKVLR